METFDFIFMFVPIVILTIGVAMIYFPDRANRKLKKRCSQETQATCIRLEEPEGDPGLSTPVFQIEHNGIKQEVHNNIYSNSNNISEGDIITLYYNPEKPDEFYIPGQKNPAVLILTIVGVFFMIFAITMLIFSKGTMYIINHFPENK